MTQDGRSFGDSTGRSSALFAQLERQARLIQASLFVLVAAIAVVPPAVFFMIEVDHLRHRTAAQAYFCQTLVETHTPDVTARSHLVAELREHMGLASLAYVRLTDGAGKQLLIGDPSLTLLPAKALRPLPPNAAPWATIEVGVSDRPVVLDLVRVVLIHLAVALTLGYLLFRFPVRALNRAIAEVQASQQRVLHANRLSAIGKIYAGIAHEINNPLGIILARVGLLLADARGHAGNAELVADLELIERQGARIAERVRSLLSFIRKSDAVEKQPLDLNQVVNEVVALVEKPFAQQGVRVETDLRTLPAVEGNSNQLQQVLLNLLNNARDAMSEGGVVRVCSKGRGQEVVVQVRDSGTGLADEVRERLFEPFLTTKEAGRGTGLGLFVSYGIVEAHDGEIAVVPSEGPGTTFEIRLPAAR